MNCRRFQNRVYEYMEGTLSGGVRAAAERHLARCDACRQGVGREQQVAQRISERLRHDAESLALHPDVRRRILQAVEDKSAPPAPWEAIVGFWFRFSWPLGLAVSLLLIVGILVFHPFSGAQVHEMEAARSNSQDNHAAVSIQVSYRVPVRKFREDGNFVLDTISYEKVVANETLWPGGHAAVREKPARINP
jgi:anti-sigma factor RsiW